MLDELYVNLGIDFGTRYTKVCARSEEAGVVVCDFDGSSVDAAMISSAIEIDEKGHLVVPCDGVDPEPARALGFLKMALAERKHLSIGSETRIDGDPSDLLVRALSAHFLAEVIRRARRWTEKKWRRHIGRRDIVWSANVGLPVEFSDSALAEVFQEVIAIAWVWSERRPNISTVETLMADYNADMDGLEAEMSLCRTIPEIAAAVSSFAMSRSATPGIYVYFDVGGGTVDGVLFNLKRSHGEADINFYAGEVANLGVDWIARQVFERAKRASDPSENIEDLKSRLIDGKLESTRQSFAQFIDDIRTLVSRTIYHGWQRDGRDWSRVDVQPNTIGRPLRPLLREDTGQRLKVFLGGGGMRSPFYQWAIRGAHDARKLYQYRIPPFELLEVPMPPDLDMGALPGTEYHRFLIAHGLSVPAGEGPEVRLPREFEPIDRATARKKTAPPDYFDSKDMYD